MELKILMIILICLVVIDIFLNWHKSRLKNEKQTDDDLYRTLNNIQLDIERLDVENKKNHAVVKANFDTIGLVVKDSLNESQTVNKIDNKIMDLNQLSVLQQRDLEMAKNSLESINLIMNNKKLRGNYGEYQLNNLLTEFFCSTYKYEMQYQVGKKIVDCAIFLDNKFLPIDSKFPLEGFNKLMDDSSDATNISNFKRDIKAHITKVKGYITVGSIGYALIYIPSVSVYETIFDYPELIELSAQNRVYFTNFNNLLPIVQSILSIYKDQMRTKRIDRILKDLEILRNKYDSVNKYYSDFMVSYNAMLNKQEKLDKALKSYEFKYDKVLEYDANS